MTYKELITEKMKSLAKDKRVVFIGYNTRQGHQMNGILKGCEEKAIETPCAENLMAGIAMGMALEGYYPILCFERFDFVLIAMDAIINHLDKLPKLSGGQFNFPLCIRIIVGDSAPLDPGPQHTQDYTDIFKQYTGIEVNSCYNRYSIDNAYDDILEINKPTIIIEYRELYNKEI